MYRHTLLPKCLLMGISEKEFWNMNPYLLEAYRKADELRIKQADSDRWSQGLYFDNAVVAGVDNALNGRKSSAKYIDKPMYSEIDFSEKEKKKRRKQAQENLLNSLILMQTNFNRKKQENKTVPDT